MRKKNYVFYRRPKTTAERKANCDCEYVRAKRRPCNIPNSWDDIYPTRVNNNSWKEKRKTQYRPGGRGQEHSICIPEVQWRIYWELEWYFKDHDIPYSIEFHRRNSAWYGRQGATLTWWSDKDIGIEFILNRIPE